MNATLVIDVSAPYLNHKNLSIFSRNLNTIKYRDSSGIRTKIVGVKGEHAGQISIATLLSQPSLTKVTALSTVPQPLPSIYTYRCLWRIPTYPPTTNVLRIHAVPDMSTELDVFYTIVFRKKLFWWHRKEDDVTWSCLGKKVAVHACALFKK